ncbi:AAA family ATPase [Halorhodospira abdelmalekii]|uniref:ExeA family protein n=1 Tax=Halorhodospira abdelmalekii TaxID=421629 RepID=UPI001903ABBE|nr:AAA family ATPase [Halorhodospira abdelmalekii]MBK1735947.1 AAA family ATPase [Halorhodospira abdelmalekii]
MYLEHFDLLDYPFRLTPNTGYFYGRASHREALDMLLGALAMGEGLIRVTGEVGTGKTLLCKKLMRALQEHHEGHWFARVIPNPALDADSLPRVIAHEFGLPAATHDTPHHLLADLHIHLQKTVRENRGTVLLIDEAQAMPDESLEMLRLITNLETEERKLLQIVLLGQPELEVRLAQPHLRQLRQRCTFSYALQPLPSTAIDDYLQHRLQIAGHRGSPLFTAAAVRLLVESSGGVPRTLNVLAHKALLSAYGEAASCVDHHHVDDAIVDTDSAVVPSLWRRLRLRVAARESVA